MLVGFFLLCDLFMTAIKYIFFSILSILFNFCCQSISDLLYTGTASFYVSLSIGTLAGLICKYILDKNFIFYHRTINKIDNLKKFTLYGLMGIWTTLIFWCSEIIFHYVFDAIVYSKYIGGLLGLLMGYTIKYHLDKKFVFTQ